VSLLNKGRKKTFEGDTIEYSWAEDKKGEKCAFIGVAVASGRPGLKGMGA